MASPRYSIVIAAYNAQDTLRKAISSVQMQTFGSWEICAVDDGSTDGTGAILDGYAETDCRIKVFHQPNCGPGAARRLALSKCAGEFVAFLDSDDYMSPDFLELCEIELNSGDIDLVFIEMVDEKADGTVVGRTNKSANRNESKDLIIRRQMTGCIGWGMGKVVRRSLLASVRADFTDLEVGEEALFGFEVVNAARAVAFVSECVYHCLKHEGGQHKKGGDDPWLPVVRAMSGHLAKVGEIEHYQRTINSFALRAMCIAVYRVASSQTPMKEAANAVADTYKRYAKEFDFTSLDVEALDKNSLLILALIRIKCFRPIVIASRCRKKQRS